MKRLLAIGFVGVMAAGVSTVASPVWAQDRPFTFSIAPAVTTSTTRRAQVRIDYDVGLGEQTFRAENANGPEHRVGVQATTGRWTLIGRFGVSSTGEARTYETSSEGEVLYSLTGPSPSGLSLAAGGGLLHEAGGVDVLVARVTAGHEAATWRLLGNMQLQRPLAKDRDALDLVSSVGYARKIGRSIALGAEAIGEDLEGFWEPDEAEGGARLLIGPSLHLAPAGRAWQVSAAGGPTFHPTTSARASGALRDLSATTLGTGYAFKVSFSASF